MSFEEWEKKFMESTEKRGDGKMVKLREILALIDGEEEMPDNFKVLPDDFKPFEDLRAASNTRVNIFFGHGPDARVHTYASHPILIPWYNCPVESVKPSRENSLDIFIKHAEFLDRGNGARTWQY